ncbi:hypothetical protein Tco_0749855 [Tanacetum coccineum]|uniref:Uncharacterized protein n=1 Tax=Tanacetum coccineum TaxID=301880 RepID=A0ABQ4YZL8_9ASTR
MQHPSDAKIVKESHHLSSPLLKRCPSHTTAPSSEGVVILLPTLDEIVASLPDPRLAKKLKGPSLAPIPRLGKRLGAPPSIAVASVSEPSHVGTSPPAPTFGRSLYLGGAVASGRAGKSGAHMDEVMRRQMDQLDCLARSALARDAEYDQILDDDFGTATRGEEIDLTIFPLAPGPYHMPYPHEGVSSPLYTREEWNRPHAPECNVLCKDIFKDPDVCRKALDRTITPESLLPLEFSNHVNVLSALWVSHCYVLNSRYTNLVSSRAHLQEKLDKKKGDVKLLRLEVTSLDSKLENLQRDCDALCQENRELRSHRDAASEEFVGSGVEGIVQKLLSSDEFHTALALVAYFGINYGVERGLRIGRTDVEFEAAIQKVSNFHVGAKADFDKTPDDFPTAPFPFLSKIDAASEGSLSNVVQILPDKFVRSATSVAAAPSSANEALKQVPP